jgi:hypothetical protein
MDRGPVVNNSMQRRLWVPYLAGVQVLERVRDDQRRRAVVDAVPARRVGRELRVGHEMDACLGPPLFLLRQSVADDPHLRTHACTVFDQTIQRFGAVIKVNKTERRGKHSTVPCCCSCEKEPYACALPGAAPASDCHTGPHPPPEPAFSTNQIKARS